MRSRTRKTKSIGPLVSEEFDKEVSKFQQENNEAYLTKSGIVAVGNEDEKAVYFWGIIDYESPDSNECGCTNCGCK